MTRVVRTKVCVVGGGPAGLMHALLLARAGIEVVVLEKHQDFLRDFRGDTVHPTTMRIMGELGLIEEFLRLPHTEVRRVAFDTGTGVRTFGNFRGLKFFRLPQPYVALMPQWDFLDFLAEKAAEYPEFELIRQAQVTELIWERGRVVGVRTPELEVRSQLVIAADGRKSAVREATGLPLASKHAAMDVLWFRLPWRPGDPEEPYGAIRKGQFLAMIYRGDYWQIASLIPKGSHPQSGSFEEFQKRLATVQPHFADRVPELRSWEDISHLDVRVDRLETWWRPGVLCIGDAAHAMSPVGGVGINLAVADAVAAANILHQPLRENRLTTTHLAKVQRRRQLPTRVIQAVQVFLQNRFIEPTLTGDLSPVRVPGYIGRGPLQFLPPIAVGRGLRPEHVHTPNTH